MTMYATHMSLDHLHSSLSDLGDGSWDIYHILFLYLLQNVVNGNKCTCATHTSTERGIAFVNLFHIHSHTSIPAVHKHGSPGGVVLSLHFPVEG